MSNLIEVRTYKGKRQSDAARDYQKDAQRLAASGWEPVSQSWAEGRSGCLRLLVMGFIFALIIKPKGTLTVTYKLTPVAQSPIEPQRSPTPDA